MTRITHGMDVDRVEQMGARLQNECSAQLRDLATEIDQLVESVVGPQWKGRDADRFRNWWPDKKSALHAAAEDLYGFGQSALNNAAEQRQASSPGGGAGDHSSLTKLGGVEAGRPQDFENVTAFSVDRSGGFVLRRGVSDGFEASHGRHGSEVTYSTAQYAALELDDLVQAGEFAATVKGKNLESPVSLGFEARAFEGTQFIWRDDLQGTGDIPVRMTGWRNLVDGYTANEVFADIRDGQLGVPHAIAGYSGVSTAASVDVEAGSSVFGAEGEVSVQHFSELRSDGSQRETVVMSGSSSTSAGLHIDTGINAGVEVKGVSGSETTVELSTVYSPQGEAVQLEYKVIGHAEFGGEVEVGFAGGGAYMSDSNGVLVERTLTYDLTDPVVAEVVQADGSTEGLAWHSDWASEEVRVFSTESQGQGADAIVFKVDTEAESMSLVDSQSRGPNRADRLITGNPELTRQYVTNSDGSRSTVYTDTF